ncbi:Ribosome-binding factor A [hydrothermal vent metagenome]|uniref:Ribosome-binding factor A n=1 Tax=hydrothermal vent metagenome TaxID=652676 RepID=A0A3B0Y303_9ZZZZ
MPKQSSRSRRIAEQIKRELAMLAQSGLKDPRLSLLTISAVEVSSDYAHAKIWFSTLNPDPNQAELVELLNFSGSFLRRELGKSLRLRIVPQLHFEYDNSVENGSRMSSLIENAIAEDENKDAIKQHSDNNDDKN